VLEVYIRYLRQKLELENGVATHSYRSQRGIRTARESVMSLRLRLTILYSALTGGNFAYLGVLVFFLVNVLLVTQIDDTIIQSLYRLDQRPAG